MHKKSIGGRSSINPIRISSIDNQDRNSIRHDPRKTQVIKPRVRSSSEENTHIPRPRIRSSSVDARKSSLKPPGKALNSQYGGTTPAKCSTTPRSTSGARPHVSSATSNRAVSPSAEFASNITSKAPRKDTRPITDKSFQSTMLYKIDSYMQSIQKSSMLNNSGSLKPITLKMFVEVSDLLVKLLGIKQDLTIVNYVEELPKCGKKLHYPGVITKSWLKTANAMHSWPQVLGWLSWLAEICQAKDLAHNYFTIENLPFIETESIKHYNGMKLKFMLDGYTAWNEEKLDEEAEIVDRFLRNVAQGQEITEKAVEKLQVEYDNEMAKLESAKETGEAIEKEIEKLNEILASLEQDQPKQEKHLKAMIEHLQKILAETKTVEQEYKILYAEVEEHAVKQEKLKVQISQQPMSSVEREEIINLCNAVTNDSCELDAQLRELEENLYALDIKLTSEKSHLDKAIFSHNKDIYEHLGENDYVNLDDLVLPDRKILGQDIMDEMNAQAELMEQFEQRLEESIKNSNLTNETMQKQINNLVNNKVALEEEKKKIIAEFEENQNRINDIQAAVEAEELELKVEIKNLEDDIKVTQDSMPTIEAIMSEVTEAKNKLEAVQRRHVFVEEAAVRFFDGFFKILSDHRTKLHSALTEYESSKK